MINQLNYIMRDCDRLTKERVINLFKEWCTEGRIKPNRRETDIVSNAVCTIAARISNAGRVYVYFDPYARKIRTRTKKAYIDPHNELVGVYTEPDRSLIREDILYVMGGNNNE